MKRVARWSSSSGCDGGSPVTPKLSTDFTRPVPKRWCQTRLTMTRETRGLRGLESHCANSSLPLCLTLTTGSPGNATTLRNPRGTRGPCFSASPRIRIAASLNVLASRTPRATGPLAAGSFNLANSARNRFSFCLAAASFASLSAAFCSPCGACPSASTSARVSASSFPTRLSFSSDGLTAVVPVPMRRSSCGS